MKFVLAGRGDYEWMRATIRERGLAERGVTLLASHACGARSGARDLVAWVLEDALRARSGADAQSDCQFDAQGV